MSQVASPTIPRDVEPPLRRSIDSVHGYFGGSVLLALSLPLLAGLVAFGYRAAMVLAVVVASCGLAMALLRPILPLRSARPTWRWLTAAVLLSSMLPPQLAGGTLQLADRTVSLWPILPAAGFLLAISLALLGRVGSGRMDAVLLGVLALTFLVAPALTPTTVLQAGRALTGDVLNAPAGLAEPAKLPWIDAPPIPAHDAVRLASPAETLIGYTSGVLPPQRTWTSLEALLRDQLPPLEDLLILGVPAPIGSASGVAVVIGGLLLVYRGVSDWRIPVMMILSAFIAFLVLPVPLVVGEQGPRYAWLAGLHHGGSWAVAVTFANYQLSASPLFFSAFFLAPLPSLRPISRSARPVYGLLLGVTSAALQLYVSVSSGPYIALLAIGLVVPLMDRLARARPLL